MSKLNTLDNTSSQYRRGTVIGLTLAEMFVLISFILILILGLWKVQGDQKMEQLLGEIPKISPSEMVELTTLISSGMAAPLVKSRDLQDLVSGLSKLPKTEQTSFVELVRASGYADIAKWAHNISAAIEQGSTADDIEATLALLKGHSKSELKAVADLMKSSRLASLMEAAQKADDIENLLEGSEAAGRRFASELQLRAGALVRELGGKIDDATGAVTLPEEALFKQGSATLTSQTKKVLNSFCFPWLDTAKRVSDIDQLQIEGHASSEWNIADSEAHAFVQNMHLSQVRASRVLEYCLGNADNEELARWARARLVAIGFSSAKVIRDDEGVELPSLSRRVVFRANVNHSRLLNNIETKVQE